MPSGKLIEGQKGQAVSGQLQKMQMLSTQLAKAEALSLEFALYQKAWQDYQS